MKAIHNYIATLIDIVPPVFAGGRFASGASNSATGTVGGTFNPFTYTSPNVTCTDSPTAGPNKGTTQTFTLGADNFEFRNAVAGTTVVSIANVFDNLSNGAWQASSTFKTAGTYYLRYKATDAAGNETPNDADHYLTVTVSAPSPIYTRTTTAGTNTTIAANTYGAWKGWNATEDWTLVLTFTANIPHSTSASQIFEWTPSGCKIEIMMPTTGQNVYVNWQNLNSGQVERLQFTTVTSLSNATVYSIAVTYDSTAYNAGPYTIPDLSNGAQSSSASLKFYLKAAGQGSGTYALVNLKDVYDDWDNSHPRTFPPGDGSTAIKCPSWSYNNGSTPVSYVAFYNATISESQLNSDH